MMSRLMMAILSVVLLMSLSGCGSSADQSTMPPENSEPKNEQPQPSAEQGSDAGSAAEKTAGETANGAHYRVNSGRSRFTARVFVGGLFSAFGHDHTIAIRSFSGDVNLTPGTLQPATLRIAIKADSLAEIDKEFDEKDRQAVNRAMHEQALETSKYPEIVFNSTSISVNKLAEGNYQARITGNLTLHGVTHPISFPAQVRLDGNSLRAQGEFTVLHSSYNMKRVSAGGGTVKAKDEMKLSFDIVADKV